MAEIIGTTVGVVGFLGQLFHGCVKAYGYFTEATHMDGDSQKLLCKVRIEEMRLVVWGREWGVVEGEFEAHLDRSEGSNPQLRRLAKQILEELHGTVTDFKKLKETYGLVDEPGEQARAKSKGDSKNSPKDESVNSLKSEKSWRRELTLRSKWVIGDKSKFITLLNDLKDFNDGLERLFPPSQVQSFQRAWTHQLLETAQRDLNKLSLLENASSGIYPHLTNSANLKKLRINLDTKPQSSFKPTYRLKVPRPALSFPEQPKDNKKADETVSPLRFQAQHETAGDVVIEWVDYDKDALDERLAHLRRMDDLARMMHSASSCHPDLQSVDCLGYTDDADRSRYGLVYKAPAPSHSTLHTLISSPDLKTPDLDDRVRLASSLAVALWSLHSLDWLHKSLRADNILFFPSAFSASAVSPTATAALVPDISRPFLVGFDASRPDLDPALSLAPRRQPSPVANLHRHPSSLRGLPYCKAFDVYSLGLLLLEIGLWKCLQSYHRPHYSPERWRDKVVLPVLVPGLGSKVGKRYKEVVEMCLGADEGMTSSEAGKLMESVVAKLESIRL
ncbi:unnamed protein product [Clonostachys byssicola]|uniref:Protein kinase domain-containing protein n=1 Tax=Clonostachys byssicola TaxID=160290 RepID=A0A9N9U063_9HYPO|nr:unnamed protein product [Clonostachys byssicola]